MRHAEHPAQAYFAERYPAEEPIMTSTPIKTIYITQHSHLDIGFTGTEAEVSRASVESIDLAIKLCGEHPDYKWTIESLWQLEQWMEGKSAEEIERLMSLVRSGRMSVCACHSGMHSANMGAEEVCRLMYPAERLRREHGIEIVTAMQNDIPGFSWAYPQVFAKSGVQYFLNGANAFIGMGSSLSMYDGPFYWEGPDGSRVLTYIAGEPPIGKSGYLMAILDFGWVKGGRAEETVPAFLGRLEKSGYAYDSVLVMGSTGDNEHPSTAVIECVREWNENHDTPRMVIATPEEFFAHMEAEYSEKFPVYRGDWSGLWDQVAVAKPYARGLAREVQNRLPAAEALAAANSVLGIRQYPREAVDSAWRDLLVTDEHSGGGVWPDLITREQGLGEAQDALRHAVEAHETASKVFADSLQSLASRIRSEDEGILVWNPLPWTRSGWVDVDLEGEEIVLRAEDVPGLGYKVIPSPVASHSPGDPSPALENEFLRLEVGPDGLIASFYDKRTGIEYVDQDSKHGFGELVQVLAGQELGTQTNPSISVEDGRIIITDSLSPLARVEITIRSGEPIIRFRHVLDTTRLPHAPLGQGLTCEIAYPLSISDGRLVFDTPAGLLNPETDYMPGASCIVHVQYGGDVIGREAGMAFASRQAFNWEIDKPTDLRMRLLKKCDEAKYKGGAGDYRHEPGAPDVLVYETAFMPHEPGADIMRFLILEANPLAAVRIARNPDGFLTDSGQLIRFDGEGFALLALKEAEEGSGFVLRLMEIWGRSTELAVKPGLLFIEEAFLVDNVERPVERIPVNQGSVRVSLDPYEIKTLRLVLTENVP